MGGPPGTFLVVMAKGGIRRSGVVVNSVNSERSQFSIDRFSLLDSGGNLSIRM
jgi:hypothetical protein